MRNRLQIFETNYGREAGITVLLDGSPAAELSDPQQEDMFWHSYRVTSVSRACMPPVDSPEFWTDEMLPRMTFVSELTHAPLLPCFFATPVSNPVERITLRGDSVLPPGRTDPYPWERVTMWWRSRQ